MFSRRNQRHENTRTKRTEQFLAWAGRSIATTASMTSTKKEGDDARSPGALAVAETAGSTPLAAWSGSPRGRTPLGGTSPRRRLYLQPR